VVILERVNDYVPAPVEGYKKDDSPDFCAQRLDALIRGQKSGVEDRRSDAEDQQPQAKPPASGDLYTFETVTNGIVTYDHALCATCESKVCVRECVPQILSLNEEGLPELNISREEARKGGCIECLACEVDCLFYGAGGGRIELPI
jgi:ferredoxin-like protein FixX